MIFNFLSFIIVMYILWKEETFSSFLILIWWYGKVDMISFNRINSILLMQHILFFFQYFTLFSLSHCFCVCVCVCLSHFLYLINFWKRSTDSNSATYEVSFFIRSSSATEGVVRVLVRVRGQHWVPAAGYRWAYSIGRGKTIISSDMKFTIE